MAILMLIYGAEVRSTIDINISRLRSTEILLLRKIDGETNWDGSLNKEWVTKGTYSPYHN